MKEYLELDPLRMDIAEVQTTLPEMSEEQTIAYKIKRKSNYSRPFTEKSVEELQEQFPDGRIRDGRFTVDTIDSYGLSVRRIFDERGFEVEKATYNKNALTGEYATDESFADRITSYYDDEGYLVGAIYLRKTPYDMQPGGYVRVIEYETLETPRGTVKVPKQSVTQAVLPNPQDPSLRVPGWRIEYRNPTIIDFTDVLFIPPEESSETETLEDNFADLSQS